MVRCCCVCRVWSVAPWMEMHRQAIAAGVEVVVGIDTYNYSHLFLHAGESIPSAPEEMNTHKLHLRTRCLLEALHTHCSVCKHISPLVSFFWLVGYLFYSNKYSTPIPVLVFASILVFQDSSAPDFPSHNSFRSTKRIREDRFAHTILAKLAG